jgi:hypothetical protein
MVRNAAKGFADRAIAGPHAYEQIPALVERGKLRVRDFYADLEARLMHMFGIQRRGRNITAALQRTGAPNCLII